MLFWDRFVWAVYFGLANYVPVGREAAVRIVEMTLSRHTFLPALSDVSVFLLRALLPSTSLYRPAVVSLASARGLLDSVQLLVTSLAATPRRLTDVVESYRTHEQDTRDAALAALLQPGHLMLYENLHLFLARRFLIDPVNLELHNLVVFSISTGPIATSESQAGRRTTCASSTKSYSRARDRWRFCRPCRPLR